MKNPLVPSLYCQRTGGCRRPCLSRVLAMLIVVGFTSSWGLSQTVTQTLSLQPGWNAVFLEVEPTDNSPAVVFAGLPIESAWTRAETVASAEFIQDPAEATFNRAAWLGWLAPGRADSFLSNLHALQAHRAYLIKVNGSSPVSLSLEGATPFRQPVWVPDAYTLQGFPADEATPPTFAQFFQHSAAHIDSAVGPSSLEAYRLVNSQWTRVTPSEPIRRGEAYWVYTRGASEYAGPLSLALDLGDGLRFADSLVELPLHFNNLAPSAMTVTVEELTGGGPGALSYHEFSPTEGNQWLPLAAPWTRTYAAEERDRLRLAIRRQDFTADTYASVLRVNDSAGSEWFIPVTAERQSASQTAALRPMDAGRQDTSDAVKRRAGLWLGSATINAVSEVHSAAPDIPTPTRSTFSLRLIIHLDATGQARLLKQVTQMWQNGTTMANAEGDQEVVEPGRYVLITDDRLIGSFAGATLRDGTPVGRRLSAVGYDFGGDPDQHFRALEGEFELGQTLTATLTTTVDHPTNPFRHSYHPDHDNLNARFDGPADEAYQTVRTLELTFTGDPPEGTPPTPDYGYNQMGGIYRETIVGLHKSSLRVQGTFSLRRISLVPDLNPSPNL